MDDVNLDDEGVGWPSYVDFLSTFVFVLFIFIGSLLYLLSGDMRKRSFEEMIGPYIKSLNEHGISNLLVGRQLHIGLEEKVEFENGKWAVLEKHERFLQEVGQNLAKAPPGCKRIIVQGYADRVPFCEEWRGNKCVKEDPFGNWNLSAKRALAVLRFFYLCSNCGYGEGVRKKLTLSGQGDISSAPDLGGSHKDRRVDVIMDYGDDH